MGTRALIKINIKDGESVTPLVCIYKQHDGYPSGLGAMLHEFLSRKTLINGISGKPDPVNYSNGIGDLAGQLVCELKNKFDLGGVYLYPTSTTDVGQDYTYTVNFSQSKSFDSVDALDSISIDGYDDEAVFSGDEMLSEFKAHIEKEDE